VKKLATLGSTIFFFSATLAYATSINFEQFTDSELLTNQVPGLTFSNTTVLTAGISLNELEFPPHSGQNVASDNGGPIRITFATPIFSFSGFFTYTTTITLTGLSATNNVLASTASQYSANYIGSGVAGASPNEFLQISSTSGVSQIDILGDPAGGSFVMDDITFTSATPEPATLILGAGGTALLVLRSKRFPKIPS